MSAGDLAEHARLRRCAEIYAIGADRRDKAMWRAILAKDCMIEGPGFSIAGREANLGSLDFLRSSFRATRHCVHQCLAVIEGNEAEGETYGAAEHLLAETDSILVWSIRYRDRWRREGGAWLFTRRSLVVDWEETRPVTPKDFAR